MALDKSWFTEPMEKTGTAFSLKGKRLHREKTPYQEIEIWQTETFGYLMTIDGCTMVSTRDNFLYHEMMSHPALNSHPDPRNVVIVGGGDCGTLREVLRHPEVKSATQVEIDERVTRLSEKYFPELCAANSDRRATLYFGDGIQWMKDARPGSIDLIIIDSTDPVGPAEGLFNKAFFESCFRALKDDGLLVQQSESPLALLDLIKDMRAEMGKAGFRSFKTLPFPQPCYPTGWWSVTLASKRDGFGFGFRQADAAAKPFETLYYTAHLHAGLEVAPPFVARALGE